MTVLRGGLLADGTGAPLRPADVVIEGDRIAAVAEPGIAAGGGDTVDLDGLVLAPGFIDCHTHYDAQVLWDPDLTPSSWHGVTTVVMGNCGFGIARPVPPARDDRPHAGERRGHVGGGAVRRHPLELRDLPRVPGRGRAGRAEAERGRHARPHPAAAVRAGRGGGRAGRHLAEIGEMRRLVGEALDAGAIGFASSRQPAHAGAWGKPVPSRLATVDELMRLAEPLAERGRGTFAITHGPDFGPVELAELSVKTGRPVTWTALNASPGAFRLLDNAAVHGGDVWPQVACRPIVFQVTLAEPAPFARADAFAEVLSVPAAERARFYRTRPGGTGPGRMWPGSGTTAGTRCSWPRRPRTLSWPTGSRWRSWPPGAAPIRSTCCATWRSTMTWRRASGSWSPTTTPSRSPGCCATTAPCSACPTRARTPASSATRSSAPTCSSTGSGRPARCRWRRRSGGSPGTRPRSSASPAGAGSHPATTPTWSRSIPPPSGWSGWSGSGTCPPARTGSSPAATGCIRSG